jgi:hypothetical protein
MSERDYDPPILVASSSVEGSTLPEMTSAAHETFRNLTTLNDADFEHQYLVVIDVAVPGQQQTTLGGDVVVRSWKAECHLYHAPVRS